MTVVYDLTKLSENKKQQLQRNVFIMLRYRKMVATAMGDAMNICQWQDSGNHYQTSCGHSLTLDNGTIYDNECEYCPYCGGQIDLGLLD